MYFINNNIYTMTTSLYKASYEGDIAKIQELLAAGINVNENNESWCEWGSVFLNSENKLSPIYGAIKGAHILAVQLLIEHKADLNQNGGGNSGVYPLVVAGQCLSSVFQQEGPRPEVAWPRVTPTDSTSTGHFPVSNQEELDEYMQKKEKLDRTGVCPSCIGWGDKVLKEQKYREIIDLLIVNGAYKGFDDVYYNGINDHYYHGATVSPTRGLTSYIIDQGDGAICFLDNLFKYRRKFIAQGHIPSTSDACNDLNFIRRMISHAKRGIVVLSCGPHDYTMPIKNTHLLQILSNIQRGKSCGSFTYFEPLFLELLETHVQLRDLPSIVTSYLFWDLGTYGSFNLPV
jgi:hypothetical protein